MASRDGREAIHEARKSAKEADKAHARDVKEAEKTLRRAQREHDIAVRAVENERKSILGEMTKKYASIPSATLYGDHVQLGSGSVALTDDITASVDTSGSIYSTAKVTGGTHVSLGGAAVGAMIAGPLGAVVGGRKNDVKTTTETHDDRKAFLTISGRSGGASIEIRPDYEGQARDFAARVMSMGKTYESRRADCEARAKEMLPRITAAKEDTAAIDAARSALSLVESDTEAVDAAHESMDRVMASADPADARSESAPARAANMIGRVVLMAIAVLLGIAGIDGVVTDQSHMSGAVTCLVIAAGCVAGFVALTKKEHVRTMSKADSA